MILNNTLVTGGAGFIGSHLVEKLLKLDVSVKVIDNLSTGLEKNIETCKKNKKFQFIQNDFSSDSVRKQFKDVDTVFHVAAHSDVRTGFKNPQQSFEDVIKTYQLLENMRNANTENIVFTSSSVVYGEAKVFPTPENYGPLLPISIYGGVKLACEGLISAYCKNYGIKGIIFRFANVIGSRSRHGVIKDFFDKLKQDPCKLEILGDGSQIKSYIHVDDCIDGILFPLDKTNHDISIFNLGNEDWMDVITIGKIVCDCLNVNHNVMSTVGGTEDGRGWKGDVKQMKLDISKIKSLDWHPKLNSKQAVKKTCDEILHLLQEK